MSSRGLLRRLDDGCGAKKYIVLADSCYANVTGSFSQSTTSSDSRVAGISAPVNWADVEDGRRRSPVMLVE
jgi:hypothetical protein